MQQVLISILVSFFISFYAIPVIIFIANAREFFDVPDHRKVHAAPIPLLGGVGIFAGFILSFILNISFNHSFEEYQFYLAAFSIVFFLGVSDDLLTLSALKKFVGQLTVTFILIFKSHLLIDNLHGFLGIYTLSPFVSYPLTYLTIIAIMNAFNLIDGVDGLAGTISIIATVLFGSWFLLNKDYTFAVIAFSLSGGIAAFLIYNFTPAKIFMGEAGSMLLGLVNAILVIRFIEVAPTAAKLPFTSSPAIGFGMLMIPLMDTLRVFCLRLYNKRSPFSPDRNHLHHLFLERGYSHPVTTACIAIFSLICICFSVSLSKINSTVIILAQIAFFFFTIFLITLIKPGTIMHVVKTDKGKATLQEKKRPLLISIFYKKQEGIAADDR